MKINRISIIIPAYNEEKTVGIVMNKVAGVNLPKIKKEIIIVNDGSTDKTESIIKKCMKPKMLFINKKINQGKGAAIKDALKKATGDVIVIQDSDLEYNPNEIKKLLQPIKNGEADVVYGSRFLGGKPHRVLFFWHMVGNKFLTLITNMVINMNMTDMETCYKFFTKDIAKKINIQEKRFGFEAEFTIKAAQINARFYEMGISYSGRSYEQGKKIGWRDGLWTLWCIVKYTLIRQK